MNRPAVWHLPLLIGLVLGICLAALGIYFSVQDRSQALAALRSQPEVSASPAATAVPAPSQAAPPTSVLTPLEPTASGSTPPAAQTPTPSAVSTLPPTHPAAPDALLQAEAALGGKDLPGVRDTLLGLLGSENDPYLVARIFTDLGALETTLGHIHVACGYYEQAYALQKNPGNLLKLADADTLAGKPQQARVRYMELLDWQGPEADPYREKAQEGLDLVNMILNSSASSTAR